jgi:lambda repressor-like predicted transcriptional regulator
MMGRRKLRLMVTALVLAVMVTLVATSAASAEPPAPEGYWYQVKPGDTWYELSRRTGLSVQTLWNANPAHHHQNDWLYYGHWLWIPSPPPPEGYWYQVEPGDTWYALSRRTGLSVQTLWNANPAHHHQNDWLYYGHWLWIPGSEAGWQIYDNPLAGFTFKYPAGWIIEQEYFYETLSGIKAEYPTVVLKQIGTENYIAINQRQFQCGWGTCAEIGRCWIGTYSDDPEVLRVFDEIVASFEIQ